MLHFITPGSLPIDAVTTMGVSVKETENPIGRFGTGLKYAIAGILRLSGSISVTTSGTVYAFTTKPITVRSETFYVVYCNGERCGFTTELGKHWKPWMFFRELASNTLDEGGWWSSSATVLNGYSVVSVNCPPVEAAKNDAVFLNTDSERVAHSPFDAEIYDEPSPYFYYQGIRVGEWGMTAPVTVNLFNATLSEDRSVGIHDAKRELSYCIRNDLNVNLDFLYRVATSPKASFWGQTIEDYIFNLQDNKRSAEFLHGVQKNIQLPVMREALNEYLKKTNQESFEITEIPDKANSYIKKAKRICKKAGIDVVSDNKLFFTKSLPDGCLGATNMQDRTVFLSTQSVMLGENEFVRTYIEECFHAMTGYADCTREMQDALFAIIVSMAE